MANINRDYLVIADLKSGKITSPNMSFYNTDKNIANLFVKLQITMSTNPSITGFVNKEEASNYNVKLTVVKPKTTMLVELTGVVQDESVMGNGAVYLFDMPQNFTDQVGKYICELEITCMVNGREKIVTCDPFRYTVKASAVTGLNVEIEPNPDIPVLRQLIDEVRYLQENEVSAETFAAYQKITDDKLKQVEIDLNEAVANATNGSESVTNSEIVLARKGKTSLREKIDEFDSQIKDKANLDEVRLKTSSIGINDLDEETKKAILENNNIDISYVLDDNSVTRDKLKNNEIYGEKVHFVKSKCQYVNYSEVIENKYYGHGNINTVTSENGCIYPPIKIFSGVTYYYKNLYAYFSNIKYNNGTIKALTDKTTGIVEGSFFAEDDGLLYCTVNKVYYDQGIFPMVANNEDFPHHYTYGDYETSIPTLKDVGVESTKFANKVYQYIDPLKLTHGRYYGRNNTNSTTGENVAILEPLSIKKGEHYYFKNIYAYFSCVEYSNGTIKALSDETAGYKSGDFMAEQDGTLYVTINTTYDYLGNKIALSNSPLGLQPSKAGYVGTEIIDIIIPKNNEIENTIKTTVITVKKDGSGDFIKITDAINSISDSNQFNQYEIHVYSKTYDLVEEFGGLEWVQSISHDNGEKQGLVLPDYVHLIGHGSVYVDCIVSDENATSDFAKSVSTINVWKNNRLEGITFRAKNTRYVIHDETGNGFSDLTRLIKNCRFIHLGTKSNLWSSPKAIGGGMGSGGRYDIINSHFESPFIPFSYHNNENQKSNYLNIDGCTFTGNKSAHQYDIGFGYYKKNTEKTYITVKNCISDRGLKVHQEISNIESDNVFEVIEINNIIRS